MKLASRNESHGFAVRTLRNLQQIESDRASHTGQVHLVTQYVLSLLGLVVFPYAAGVTKQIKKRRLKDLSADGWPEWQLTLGQSQTLGNLLEHLRHATCHRRIRFSSDSLDPAEVNIVFEDAKSNTTAAYWRASIRGDHLREFCVRFGALICDAAG